MKKYKLLKDLPFAKAGEEFKEMHNDGRIVLAPEDWDQHRHEIDISDIKNFDEWFEEIKEPKLYFTIDFFRKEVIQISDSGIMGWAVDNIKSLGFLFETREEDEKYLEYLKAKAIIEQDTKGANFDWTGVSRVKYYGVWNCRPDILNKQLGLEYRKTITDRVSTIYFNSEKDIKESFKKHPEEWKTYLTYDQQANR